MYGETVPQNLSDSHYFGEKDRRSEHGHLLENYNDEWIKHFPGSSKWTFFLSHLFRLLPSNITIHFVIKAGHSEHIIAHPQYTTLLG